MIIYSPSSFETCFDFIVMIKLFPHSGSSFWDCGSYRISSDQCKTFCVSMSEFRESGFWAVTCSEIEHWVCSYAVAIFAILLIRPQDCNLFIPIPAFRITTVVPSINCAYCNILWPATSRQKNTHKLQRYILWFCQNLDPHYRVCSLWIMSPDACDWWCPWCIWYLTCVLSLRLHIGLSIERVWLEGLWFLDIDLCV